MIQPRRLLLLNARAGPPSPCAVITVQTHRHRAGYRALRIILCVLLALHLAVFLNATLAYVIFPYEGKSVVDLLERTSIRARRLRSQVTTATSK